MKKLNHFRRKVNLTFEQAEKQLKNIAAEKGENYYVLTFTNKRDECFYGYIHNYGSFSSDSWEECLEHFRKMPKVIKKTLSIQEDLPF